MKTGNNILMEIKKTYFIHVKIIKERNCLLLPSILFMTLPFINSVVYALDEHYRPEYTLFTYEKKQYKIQKDYVPQDILKNEVYKPSYVTSPKFNPSGFDVNNYIKPQTFTGNDPMKTWSGFDVNSYIKQQVSTVPNPMNTWMQQKIIDDTKTAAKIGLNIGGMMAWPPSFPYFSVIGLGAKIGSAFSPYGSSQREVCKTVNDFASVGGIITSGSVPQAIYGAGSFVAGQERMPLHNNFNPNKTITHTSPPISLNRTWNDGINKGQITGDMTITNTFKPEPNLFRGNTYPWGTYSESKTLNKDLRIIETRGINDINSFQRQWGVNNYTSPSTNFNTYTPRSFNTYSSPSFNTYRPR